MSKKTFQNLSSTTLFNFTNTFTHLANHLENGFYCGDVYEKFPFGLNIGYKVPMVCFCDIPLGQVKEHLVWYGSYAIGIKKAYARKHNVSPVWYIHSNNPVVLKMYRSTNKDELRNSPVLPYLKQYLGNQKDLNKKVRMKKFYDEREWRFIPLQDNFKAEIMIGSHAANEAEVEKRKRVTRMNLDLHEVEYIIVSKEEEKEKLYPILRKLSLKHKVKYENLVSAIITCSQIRKDF